MSWVSYDLTINERIPCGGHRFSSRSNGKETQGAFFPAGLCVKRPIVGRRTSILGAEMDFDLTCIQSSARGGCLEDRFYF